ncbi:hypothetical protein PhCBS80983_g06377 [Powellomyces hirtus]|uniref:CSC1/OSCA1-like 7TM region domain-containing protein n=1 Tax=Powellomyces hirtus TaxID=109895 RepID=A0A507DQ79_9FUNG|nr:hypothetical protein PhCBS80983_g06377 [Powellomyces hirtus]
MSAPVPPKIEDVSLDSFISAVVIAGATGAAFYAAFTILRQRYPLVYAPRTFLVGEKNLTKPLKGALSWMTLAWNMDDADVLRRVGADSYAAIFMMRILTQLFIFLALCGAILLFPVYATGAAGNKALNRLHIGNVGQDQSARLWSSLLLSVIFVLVVIFMIFKLLKKAAWLRHTFLLGPDQHQSLSGYTLVVRDIPKNLRDPAVLRDLFNRVQPNKVLDVILIRDVKEINKHYKEHMSARDAVEKAAAKFLSTVAKKHAETLKQPASGNNIEINMENGGNDRDTPSRRILEESRPTSKAKVVFGEKRDTIAHNLKEMSKLEEKLHTERSKVYEGLGHAESAAFIIFADLFSPHVAALANIHGSPGIMLDKQAVVEPADVIWDNLDMKLYNRMIRGFITTVALTALIIFWGVLTAGLSAIASLEKLIELVSFLKFLDGLPSKVKGIIQGLLPTIAVAILFSLLPGILRFFSTFSGVMTKTAREKSLIQQYYFFLLFNVFFVITISGSIFRTLNDIKEDPEKALTILSNSVPGVCTFYINYITLLALQSPAGELLQIGALIVKPLKLKFLAGTPRAIWRTSQPPVFEPGVPFAAHSFVASIGIIYMTVAPLVTITCAFYFGLWQVAYAYKIQYCYATRSQTGGFFMHIAAKQLFVALYIHELVMVGMFLAKEAWVQTGIVIIMFIITITAHKKANQYTALMAAIPAKAALDIGLIQDLTMDANVQKELVSNEPWRDEVVAQINIDRKSEHSRRIRQKNSTSELLDGSRPNLSEDSLGQSTADIYKPAPTNVYRDPAATIDSISGVSTDDKGRVAGSHLAPDSQSAATQQQQPEHPLDAGPDEFERQFMHPALRPNPPTVWVPNDELRVAETILRPEIEAGTKARFTYEESTMDRTGKIQVPISVVARDVEP